MKVIPDTPIWSLVLRREQPNKKLQALFARMIEDGQVMLPGIIKQELLSGIRAPGHFDLLLGQLQHFPELLATSADHMHAAEYFNKCQRAGVQGSQVDFLIVAIAVSNSATILTTDKDFIHYRKIVSFELQFVNA
jgi:predicted nucleic acid-binding protein